MRKKSKKGAA